MNKRIEELAEQAGLVTTWEGWVSTHQEHAEGVSDEFLERFAELVRQDECEANVKLLEDFAKTNMVPVKDTWRMGLIAGANAIRSKHEQTR